MRERSERAYKKERSNQQVHVCEMSLSHLLSEIPTFPDHQLVRQDQRSCEYIELIGEFVTDRRLTSPM